MALADRYTEPDRRTAFEKWLDDLSAAHNEIVTRWLRDPAISNIKIVDMIRDDDPEDGFVGYRANKDSVASWRRANVSR